jgi:hypothetical protein
MRANMIVRIQIEFLNINLYSNPNNSILNSKISLDLLFNISKYIKFTTFKWILTHTQT